MVDKEKKDEPEEKKATLVEHLIELRSRLMKSVLALAVGFVACYFVAEEIYAFLVDPYATAVQDESGRRLIFTALHETFFTYLKVALFAAICISFPYIASQLWIFVAPGLYKKEKGVLLPYLFASPVLFIIGASLVYYLIMPLAINFFLSFETSGADGTLPIQLEAKVNEYLSLVMKLILAFGICFQLPVLLTLLARVGMATSEGLKKKRKYLIVAAFAVAAFLTPPDPITQIGLGIPILLLYEISIFAVKFIEKKHETQLE